MEYKMYYLTEAGREFKEIVPRREISNQSSRAVSQRQQLATMQRRASSNIMKRRAQLYKQLYNNKRSGEAS